MGRPAGRRNAAHTEKEAALAASVADALVTGGAAQSLRELATAAGTSVSNLRHYFGTREGVIAAAFAVMHARGKPFMEDGALPKSDDGREALARHITSLVLAWRVFGVGRVQGIALAEGLQHPDAGRAYVQEILEPTLQTTEKLLSALSARGDVRVDDVRSAALALIGPVFLALLHQDGVNGAACRPLDVDAFATGHLDRWWSGYARAFA